MTHPEASLPEDPNAQPPASEAQVGAEAQRRLAGLDAPPIPSEYALYDEAHSGATDLDSATEEAHAVHEVPKKPLGRTIFAGLAVGGVVAIVLMFVLGFNQSKKRPETAATPIPTSTTVAQDNSPELQSQLALQDQKRALNQDRVPPTPTPSPSPSPQARSTSNPPRVVSTSPAPSAPTSPSSYRPPQQPAYTFPQTPRPDPIPVATGQRTVAPEKPVDPYARWTALANLGTTGEEDKTSETANLSNPTTAATNATSSPQSGLPNGSSLPQPVMSSLSFSRAKDNGRSMVAPFQSVQLGAIANPQGTLVASSVPMAPPVPTEGEPSSRALPPPIAAPETDLSPGAQGILNQSNSRQFQPVKNEQVTFTNPFSNLLAITQSMVSQATGGETEPTESAAPVTVELGTIAPAQVIVPMAWDLQRNFQNSGVPIGRFVVQLTEDLKSRNGQVALVKGTRLVVQALDVNAQNQLVQAAAIAIIYQGSDGSERQEAIAPGAILVQGQNGNPLIARKLNDVGTELFKEDLLVGLLQAAGTAGQVLNQPKQSSSTVFNNGTFGGSTSGSVITESRDPQLIPALVDGFGNAISQRVQQRSEQNTQALVAKNTIAIVPQGTRVSILINSFFQVNP